MKYTEQDVTDNMGLVFLVARRMPTLTDSGAMEFQDLISEGVLGLIHALDRFDKSRGFKFSPYAYRCISGYILQGHRRLHMEHWKAQQSQYDVPTTTISMYQTGFDSDEMREVVGMDDRGMGVKNMFDIIHNNNIWDNLMPILTKRQRQMLEMRLQGLTQNQIAELLGVTRQCVSQTIQLVVVRARKFFATKEAA